MELCPSKGSLKRLVVEPRARLKWIRRPWRSMRVECSKSRASRLHHRCVPPSRWASAQYLYPEPWHGSIRVNRTRSEGANKMQAGQLPGEVRLQLNLRKGCPPGGCSSMGYFSRHDRTKLVRQRTQASLWFCAGGREAILHPLLTPWISGVEKRPRPRFHWKRQKRFQRPHSLVK